MKVFGFGDIAVLQRTRSELQQLASALEELQLPFLMESPGLLATREGALALAGLRLVADRGDSLAAATVLHILNEDGAANSTPTWLAERLAEIRNQELRRESVISDAISVEEESISRRASGSLFTIPWKDEAAFAELEAIDGNSIAPSIVLQHVIDSFSLPWLIGNWGEAARRIKAWCSSSVLHAIKATERGIR